MNGLSQLEQPAQPPKKRVFPTSSGILPQVTEQPREGAETRTGLVWENYQFFDERLNKQSSLVVPSWRPAPYDIFDDFGSAINFQLGSMSPQIPYKKNALEYVDAHFVVVDRKRVFDFIEKNSLRDILTEAIEPIDRAFGKSSVKILKVCEDDEGGRTLFCFVKWPGDLDEAFAALGAFDLSWWLRNAQKYTGRLNFDFEPI